MMKRCKLLVLLILICLLMLPVFATAETQEEFELRCFKMTAVAATVYSYLNSSEGEVIDYIPAGTYVQCKSSTRDGRTTVVYMKNGVKKQGTIKVKLIDCTSTIRKSDGLAYDIHEKDPNYDAKIKEGVLEFDVTKYSDSSAYYLYRAGAGPEPERKDGSMLWNRRMLLRPIHRPATVARPLALWNWDARLPRFSIRAKPSACQRLT